MTVSPVRVAIMDDHQSIVDGYRYRLEQEPGVVLVAAASCGNELEPMLAQHPTDVLLLDLGLPTSLQDLTPFPILQVIPHLLQAFPTLSILVISMEAKRAVVRAILQAGANGYILKDDRETILRLGQVVKQVAQGDIYLSQDIEELYRPDETEPVLTPRQLEVVALFADFPNHTSASVALQLNIAHSTVRNLLSDAYLRLGVRNRSAAILKARQLGLITTYKSSQSPAVTP